MSSIIDMSLSKTFISPFFSDKDIFEEYTRELTKSGVDYFEVKSNLIKYIPREDISRKYILRIEGKDDIALCGDFSYAVVPLKLAKFCTKISGLTRVILEIRADEYSAPAMIMHAMSLRAAKVISMIRIIYDAYSYNGEAIRELIKWYKGEYIIPIDICPLNFYMTGNISALSAEKAGAEAISLTYGANHEYTSVESFMTERGMFRSGIITSAVIGGLSNSADAYARIFGRVPYGVENMDLVAQRLDSPLAEIDTGRVYRIYRTIGNRKREPSESAVEKKLKSLGYDEEIEKCLLELIKKGKL